VLFAVDTSTRWALIIGNVALAATFFISLSFVVTYAFAPWRTYASGRNVMALMFALMLLSGLSLLRLVYAEHAWFLWLRVVVLSAIPFILAWRLWMLIRVQYMQPASPTALDRCPECPERYDHKRATPD
jgi:small-conductance mechanosensitive channel